MTTDVLVERRGAVQVITINRPAVRNALNGAVARGVADATDELDRDDALRVAVLHGADGTFSAGMDLKAYLRGDTPMIDGRGLLGITESPPRKPLIAAVEGWALAGGFEVMLACDVVVASETARFGLPEVKRSLVAMAGGTLLLPRRIPAAVAMDMLLTGEPIDATRAHELGLVSRLAAPGQALAGAIEVAEAIAANGPLAVAATKAIARWADGDGASWGRQQDEGRRVLESADAVEGARAFAEKRAPRFTGR
ncbi:crotonase/enoyl-CoA hydratase family protein [Microbacterium sp.]|uniref:crotonase/enoyl-CoA hydratase family protein n=1 Tax=Microbacterium sp. TaxID=51671 RepID=UPI0037C57DF8